MDLGRKNKTKNKTKTKQKSNIWHCVFQVFQMKKWITDSTHFTWTCISMAQDYEMNPIRFVLFYALQGLFYYAFVNVLHACSISRHGF